MGIQMAAASLHESVQNPEQKSIPVRTAQNIRTLVGMCAKEGFSARELLEGSGLTETQIDDAGTLVYRHQEFIVLKNLVSRNTDPSLAFRLGAQQRISTLGALGYALVTAPTVREAIRTGLRLLPLNTLYCTMELDESGDEGMLVLDFRGVPESLRDFVTDWDLGSTFSYLRDALQAPGSVLKIWVDHAPTTPDDVYLKAAGCLPSFNKPACIITFRRELLDTPLPLANPIAYQQSLAICEAELDRYRNLTNLSGQIRDYLLQSASAMPSLEEVAKHFLLTPRTLRRRLAAEQMTFRDLQEGVRSDLARHWLRDTRSSIQEISARLGYRDLTTFSTAFKRWTGMTPGSFRKSSREPA